MRLGHFLAARLRRHRGVVPQEIADRLALRGFEVASVEPLPNDACATRTSGEAVIDFEVTANRPDCLSVIGLAREVATAFDVPFAPTHRDRTAQTARRRRPNRRA